MKRLLVATALSAAALGAAGGASLAPQSTSAEPQTYAVNCGDYNEPEDERVCATRGYLLWGMLVNIQGADQFCKWRAANPGEWTRIKGYLSTGTVQTPIITWFGAGLRDVVQTYFAASGRPVAMPPNTAPNKCGGKLVAPPTGLTVTD